MIRSSLVLIALLLAAPAFAQNTRPATQPARPGPATAAPAALPTDAQLRLIVVDETQSGIPTANITITPPAGTPITVMTDMRGVVVIPALPVADVKVKVEFDGFEPQEGTVSLKRGENNQTVTLRLAGVTDEVTVKSDDVTSDTRGSAMATTLSTSEIEALPDDPDDLQKYLEELAGPGGATFFLNGFSGGRLPTKDEIRSIRIRSNSFAADGHDSGGRQQIEIITRPNTGSYQGAIQFGYRGDRLNARNAQSLFETPEGTKQVQLQFRGPLVANKTSFSLNVSGNDNYSSNNFIALDVNGNRRSNALVRVPSESRNVQGGIEHALTNNSTLRLSYQGQRNTGRNQGLGEFDLPERARQSESSNNMFRAQVQGVIGKTMLNEIRFQFNRRRNETSSVSDAQALIVQDAFSSGGAGATSNSLSDTFEIADNFDFTPHKNHQMRVGLLLEGGSYDYFDQTNNNGRMVYASLDDYRIDKKLQFTQRIGNVSTSFNQYQLGFYVQDDIKVNNRLSLGVGLRNEMQSHIDNVWNLMPRVGFSYNPFGNATSIRGGYGIYYDWFESNLYDTTLRLNGVTQQEIQKNYQYDVQRDELGNIILDANGRPLTLLDANNRAVELASSSNAIGGPSNRTVAADDLKMPYVHQFSLGVQQQLFANMQLQVTYQRLLGRDQLRGIDVNYGELVFDGVNFIRLRPDPTSGIVTEIQSTGRSKSDQVTFQTRYPLANNRGFMQFSYQLRKGTSNFNGATSLPSDSSNPDLDWGPQGQDIRHQIQLGGNVRLPYQVRLQSQFRFRSAPAYNLTTGLDNNRDGVVNDRPFGVTRNSLRGDSTWDIPQVSLSKTFGFGGQRGGDGGGNGGFGGPGGPGGGGFRGGNQQGQGGGFGGPGGGGNFRGNNQNNNNNSRYSVEFSLQANNPLNRVIRTGYTGNQLSRYFGTATQVQAARRISFNTSFRF